MVDVGVQITSQEVGAAKVDRHHCNCTTSVTSAPMNFTGWQLGEHKSGSRENGGESSRTKTKEAGPPYRRGHFRGS